MSTQHTPGPWAWEKTGDGLNYARLVGGVGDWLLFSDYSVRDYGLSSQSWIEIDNAADARLIAAAPCLLEALDAIAQQDLPDSLIKQLSNGHQEAIATARAAIAKARGEA